MSIAAAIGAAIVESLVTGTIVALVAVALAERCRTAAMRHAIELAGLVAMALAFVGQLAHAVGSPGAQPSFAMPQAASWWWTALGWAYATGVFVLGARLLLGARAVARLRQTTTALPAAWTQRIETWARELGIERRLELAASARIDSAMVIGWWRPLVLLPSSWVSALPPDVVEAVIVHELWHVRRHDVLLGWLQAALEILLCFHPAAWWLSRRARRSREHCCDDAAAVRCGVRRYAEALLRAEEARSVPGEPALAACRALPIGFRGGELRDRIARLIGVRRARRDFTGLVLLAVLALGLSVPTRMPTGAIGIPWLPPRVRVWEAELVAAGERHGVDPELLAIVALVESGGDPQATSPVGAKGLLQLMPSTASGVARERGLPEPTEARLLEPDVNIDFGAYYLAQQLEKFEGVELAAAAYNGGPTRVRSWLDGRTRLPQETERYRRLVAALYRERHDPWSPAFAELAARRGLSL